MTENQQKLMGVELYSIVEDLNYTNLICKVNPNDYDLLFRELKKDFCNKLWRIEYIKNKDHLFYIENCDLQDTNGYELDEDSEYIVVNIKFTKKGYILYT
jgi:hypothetical protein